MTNESGSVNWRVKRELAMSGADLALIASDYVYDNFIRNTHGAVNPDAYIHVKVNVKNTRTRAWYLLAGGPPLNRARSANGQSVRTANRRNLTLRPRMAQRASCRSGFSQLLPGSQELPAARPWCWILLFRPESVCSSPLRSDLRLA